MREIVLRGDPSRTLSDWGLVEFSIRLSFIGSIVSRKLVYDRNLPAVLAMLS